MTIGLPYFLLSTTGPLVQAWFARSYPSATVYRLFALSNLASLVALIAYPPLIEPVDLAAGAVLRLERGLRRLRRPVRAPRPGWRPKAPALLARAPETVIDETSAPTPRAARLPLWLGLSALGSLMLLAVTSHITQNVASVPFVWILPLVLYLLSFILVFDVGGARGRSGWYSRIWALPLLFALLSAMAYYLSQNLGVMNIRWSIALYCAGLFVACMFCHGELAAMRPAPKYLTRFYLMISIGGAAGGLFVGLIAPRIFHLFLELPLALIACAALAAWLTWKTARAGAPASGCTRRRCAALAVTAGAAWHAWEYLDYIRTDALVMTRNFYGTLRVKEYDRGEGPNSSRALVHGVINHGWQYTDPELRKEPISYFGPGSGIARALDFYQGRPRRVGIIGLGVGSFTAWGRPGDYFRVYELDPDVVKIAREQFWYLSDAKAKIDVVTGDGRLSMERDAPQKFDLISVDAFSSGSIPIHLLTREALQAYKRHLAPGGVIVYNVTNRFVNLAPQLKLVAEAEDMKIVLVEDSPDDNKYSGTSYVLVTQNEQLLADKRFANPGDIEPIKGLETWTDSYNNLFKVVR